MGREGYSRGNRIAITALFERAEPRAAVSGTFGSLLRTTAGEDRLRREHGILQPLGCDSARQRPI
jgi:hypothetical protein